MKRRALTKANVIARLRKGASLIDLSNYFDVSTNYIIKMLSNMSKEGYMVEFTTERPKKIITLNKELVGGGTQITKPIPISSSNYIARYGFVSDNHIGSKYSDIPFLHALYDFFEEEGVKTVYNGGNWADGFISRINLNDVVDPTMEGQIQMVIDYYPVRKGIKTKFIAGDDHEGWWTRHFGVDIGKYLELKALSQGRKDLEYLGYLEYDIEYACPGGTYVLRLVHPKKGSAYALSYQPQKYVEALSAEEARTLSKVLIAHYHKLELLPNYAGMDIIQTGCTCWQTPFLRGKGIKVMLGGGIVEDYVNDAGKIWKSTTTFITPGMLGLTHHQDYFNPETSYDDKFKWSA